MCECEGTHTDRVSHARSAPHSILAARSLSMPLYVTRASCRSVSLSAHSPTHPSHIPGRTLSTDGLAYMICLYITSIVTQNGIGFLNPSITLALMLTNGSTGRVRRRWERGGAALRKTD